MRLKIWHKMIIGISIPSLIALMSGIITYGYINNVKNRHGFVEIADDLKENVLEVRRNEKNFFHFKNSDYYKILNDAIAKLNTSFNSIPQNDINEIGKDDLSLLRETISDYSLRIKDLFESYNIEAEAVERARSEGRNLEDLAARRSLPSELSLSFILNLRRLEKNYMLFHDKSSFDELNKNILNLKNITPLCYNCIPYIDAIKDLSDAYNNSESLTSDLQVTGRELENITSRIAKKERLHIHSFFRKTQIILLIALLLLSILGPLFVYKTATHIVMPINRLAKIMLRISEGDTGLRAPLREHDETHSLSLAFNNMLDNLHQTRESLEKTVDILHEKQKEIEKRASLGFLISGVTHELNNPLNNISLTAETMKEDLNELSKEDLDEFIQDILTQSERAKHIIEDLLDFAGARKSTVMDKIDIINAVEESINLIANELRINKIQLEMDIDSKAHFIFGNRTKIEEVFINIMVNAVQAMKNGGTLTVSARPDNDMNNIIIRITDTGPGIPKDNLKNIFEPFFTTKDVGEGTGLGLSVSQGIINDHKGEISVESVEGTGTTFTISLPLFDEKGVINEV
ncbi:MAG: HAMP domain-containing histidine kinase [Nitrospirota bacterium]|nr:HAMP domain-containing histidine kinase [Nitrospirota bacterium]